VVIGCGYSSKRDAIVSNSGAKLNEKVAVRRTGSIPVSSPQPLMLCFSLRLAAEQ
jgi:hypothetical protein